MTEPQMKGCVHIHMEDGRPISVVVHIGEMWVPKNGVIHAALDDILSPEDFNKSHPNEIDEVKLSGIRLEIHKPKIIKGE